MQMKKLTAAVVLLVAATPAFSQEWVQLAETDDFAFEARAGSFESTKTKAGVPISVLTGRARNKKTTVIEFEKWYVTTQDCLKGSGKLVTLSLNGEFKFDSDYIDNGGTIASSIAGMVCGIRKSRDGRSL
jgi:hypothetical protein